MSQPIRSKLWTFHLPQGKFTYSAHSRQPVTLRQARVIARQVMQVDKLPCGTSFRCPENVCPSCLGTGGIGHCNRCGASGRVRR